MSDNYIFLVGRYGNTPNRLLLLSNCRDYRGAHDLSICESRFTTSVHVAAVASMRIRSGGEDGIRP